MDSHECVTTKKCRTCQIEKTLSEFYRNGRGGFFTECKECCKRKDRERYRLNPQEKLAKCADYRKRNKQKVKAYMAKHYEENRDYILQRCHEYRKRPEVLEQEKVRQKAYYAARAEKIQAKRAERKRLDPSVRERFNEYLKQHYQENKDRYYAKSAKRRADRLRATPPWANLDAIQQVYADAARKTEFTGEPYEVDHVIPLKGKNVCGLHVENNLRVVTRKQNRKKSNKLVG